MDLSRSARMPRHARTCLTAALAFLATVELQAYAAFYKVTRLASEDAYGYAAQAYGLNDKGQVTGNQLNTDGSNDAFLYDGTMHGLGDLRPEDDYATGYDINNAGQIAGLSSSGYLFDGNRAILYDG